MTHYLLDHGEFGPHIHTYIIGHYNPSVRILDLESHITYVVCFNFMHKWRDLQFKVDFEWQIFWETVPWQYLFTPRVFLNTYIHNWSLHNPSVRILDLVSHTTYVVCINFIHKWRDLQIKVNFERQIFWASFHGNIYLLLRVFARNLLREEIAEEMLFVFCFWYLAWVSNPSLTSNKPTVYILDYGVFLHTFKFLYRKPGLEP